MFLKNLINQFICLCAARAQGGKVNLDPAGNEEDWGDKILVKYDKEKVYKTLYDNARGGYEYFLSVAKGYEEQMKQYEDVLNNL